jgi:hypothetical protein
MKKISLTQGQVALVDDKDFERLNKWKWYTKKDKKTFYAVRNLSKVNNKQHQIYMHHEVMGRLPKGFEVDHRNGNGLYNTRGNLRFVTHRQNCQNKKNGKKKTSRYPGVCWNKQYGKWSTEIQINGKYKFLGRFVYEREAFEAYKQAVKSIGEKVIDIF